MKTTWPWALLLAASLAFPALGQRADDRPWARGVPADKQRQALELFRDGNSALKDSLFLKAAQKYREALGRWDHPAIHYNLALALVNLDQPVEVHEHLVAAMKYGALPLDVEKLEQAQRYKTLVEKQLARVELSCEVAGARVVMDGHPLFTAPGTYQALVRAGPHTIVAEREGYLTNQQSKALPAGETTRLALRLFTTEDLTQYRRRWPVALPWAVVGGGTALALGGAGLNLASKSAFETYDARVKACAGQSPNNICQPSAELTGLRRSGDTLQAAAWGGYLVGAGALVTGAVLVYLNRLQPYQATPAERTDGAAPTVTVVPVLAPGAVGAAALIRF